MAERRLLILDDDPMTGQTIQRIAEFSGVAVRFTPDPDQFFQLLADWQPTHIALDLIMPDMDGMEVMAKLSRLACPARVIITSGVGGRVLDAAGRSAAEHGLDFAGVLAKPFSPAALRRLLANPTDASRLSRTKTYVLPPQPKVTAADLRCGLNNRAFEVVYQPKVVCATGALAGFEALVRWVQPDGSRIMPCRFIPVAEQCGLIDELTEQILDQALTWFAGLEIGPEVQLALNISAKTLSNTALFEGVRMRCQNLRLAPERLIFELTETSAMDDPVASLDLLTRLRMKGFHLSIDDFGTGFSSMLQLVRLPFSEIKVDKSFVMTAMRSQESLTVTKFIVDLGHSLGLRCTAEGVEDSATLAYLRQIGCDLVQGYYISRPISGQDMIQWVKSTSGSFKTG